MKRAGWRARRCALVRCSLLVALLWGLFGCQKEKAVAKQNVSAQTLSTPSFRLLVFTDLRGTLEPCGCTERSLGGMARLAAAVRRGQADRVPTLVLSAGNLFFDSGQEPDIARAHALANILARLPLAVANPGLADLGQGQELVRELAGKAHVTLLAAGVEFAESDKAQRSAADFERAPNRTLPATTQLSIGGIKIGLIGVTLADPTATDAPMIPANALAAAADAAKGLRRNGAQVLVGLLTGPTKSARDFAQLGGLDLVVRGGGTSTPTSPNEGDSKVLSAGEKSERLLGVDVWLGSPHRIRVRAEELRRNAPEETETRWLLDQYAHQINSSNQQRFAAKLPLPANPKDDGYVGSRPCASCHTAAYLWWNRTPHGHAYQSLVDQEKEFHLDCVGCHVTGYEKPGGSTVTHVEGLKDVGCESCHGPGSAHITDARPPLRFIKSKVSPTVCLGCHTKEHSEGFDFDEYVSRLLVPGHGLPL